MAVAAILKNIKITISAAVQAIFMKFGPMTHYMYIICTNHNCQILFVFGVYFVWFPLHEGCE